MSLTNHPFVVKHQDKIEAVLSCFELVIIRGYANQPSRRRRGLAYQQGVRLKDFKNFAPAIAARLLVHAKQMAHSQGRVYRYLPTRVSKEELARDIAKTQIQQFSTVFKHQIAFSLGFLRVEDAASKT